MTWAAIKLEVMLLHEKLDLLREMQWSELLKIQREQLRLLMAMSQRPPAAI